MFCAYKSAEVYHEVALREVAAHAYELQSTVMLTKVTSQCNVCTVFTAFSHDPDSFALHTRISKKHWLTTFVSRDNFVHTY